MSFHRTNKTAYRSAEVRLWAQNEKRTGPALRHRPNGHSLNTRNPDFQGICEANWLLRARRICARRQDLFLPDHAPSPPLNKARGLQDAPLHRC